MSSLNRDHCSLDKCHTLSRMNQAHTYMDWFKKTYPKISLKCITVKPTFIRVRLGFAKSWSSRIFHATYQSKMSVELYFKDYLQLNLEKSSPQNSLSPVNRRKKNGFTWKIILITIFCAKVHVFAALELKQTSERILWYWKNHLFVSQ